MSYHLSSYTIYLQLYNYMYHDFETSCNFENLSVGV